MPVTREVAVIKAALKDFPVSVRIKRPTGRRAWRNVQIVIEKDISDGFYRFGEDCATRFNDCFPGLYNMDPDWVRIQFERDEFRKYLSEHEKAVPA